MKKFSIKSTSTLASLALSGYVTLSCFQGAGGVVAQSTSRICQVQFSGTVTKIVNLDQRIKVSVGDPLAGSLNYDPNVVTGTANPGPPGGPFKVNPLSSFAFTVGTLSGALSTTYSPGSVVPQLLNSTVASISAFFITNGGIQLNGGNTFNAGGGTFVIGNSSNGGIIGSFKVTQAPRCYPTHSFSR